MSFILDALKKSETERQQQSGGELSTVPTSSPQPRPLRWLWLLGVLLAVNLAVLIGILLRSDSPPAQPPIVDKLLADPPPVSAPADTPPADASASFAEQVAEARKNQPLETNTAVTAPAAAVTPPAPVIRSASRIPSIDELRLDGSLQLPELHIDIHVYSDVPGDRFVFINMVKHRERSRLAEGPVVDEITTDGVILEYQGRKFLLPRE
ncbi:MAG: general secretion pathway protein GspB [Gammaproteobacteria bacterium]|nr:general secretion pathway protein GspB [Gammaproteobacteria bacterium]